MISLAVPAAGWVVLIHPEITPTSNFHQLRDTTVSCKMNDIDPQAWMADVLARLPDITMSRLPELLPWNWKAEQQAVKAA